MTAKTEYIFIGGCVRSGTDLIRNALNSCETTAICGETHYLGNPRLISLISEVLFDGAAPGAAAPRGRPRWELASPASRQKLARAGDLATDAGAKQIVDYLYDEAGKVERAYWRWLTTHVGRETFLARLLETDRTERSFFKLMMALYAGDRPIRGEKTPAHIHYVPTLLEWFPNARFVHMLRDPRAIFLSEWKKKMTADHVSTTHRFFRQTRFMYQLYLCLGIAMLWLRVVQLHHQYQRLYPDQYCLLRFEDIVTDPETHLERLCTFLGIEFTDRMLQQHVVNSSFVAPESRQPGFDLSAVDRWQSHLHTLMKNWFVAACRSRLVEFGYALTA